MNRTRNLIMVSMFAALTAIGAFIKIPIPYVPITLQYLFCALSGVVLGARLGALSQIVYVLVGLAGVPVFAQGGGFDYIFKPTFGYLVGFIIAAYVIGRIRESIKEMSFIKAVIMLLSGLFFIYLPGLIYLYVSCNFLLGKSFSLYMTFFYGFAVSIGGDLIITIITAYVSVKLLSALKKNGLISIETTA